MIPINTDDHNPQITVAFLINPHGTGSWNAAKNKSIYPVNRYGLTNSKISRGINEIAEPIKTALIVMIIGVTLFLENVEIIKHKLEIASITPHDIKYARKNLHNISPSERNNNPLWKTARSPIPRKMQLIPSV